MTTYDNNLSGVLFKNDDKREGKKDPDYRGSAEINGVQFWLNAWINTAKKDGRKFMSLKFEPKQAKGAVAHKEAPVDARPTSEDDFNDEIPFAFLLAPLAGLLIALTGIAGQAAHYAA